MADDVSRRSRRALQVINDLSFRCLSSSDLQCYWKVGDMMGWGLLYRLWVLWKLCNNSAMGFPEIDAWVQSASYNGTTILHSFSSSIRQTRSPLDLLRTNISIRDVFAWLWEVLFLSMKEVKRSVVHPHNFSLFGSFILLWLSDYFLYDAKLLLLLAHPFKQVLIFQRFLWPIKGITLILKGKDQLFLLNVV